MVNLHVLLCVQGAAEQLVVDGDDGRAEPTSETSHQIQCNELDRKTANGMMRSQE